MKKDFDVIVVGELNVDLILDGMEHLPVVGKEILANKMTLTLGSSSAIFASNLACLGARVAFIGKIGDDLFGDFVLDSLTRNQVDVSMIRKDADAGTGATVILNVQEDRANTTFPGAMNLLTPEDISQDDLRRAKHLHFSSFFLQPGIQHGIGKLFKRAQELGLTTSFDMQWDPMERWDLPIEEVLPYVNVFLPNEKELMFLTRKNNLNEAIGLAKKHTDILVIKRGNQGSMVCYKDEILNRPAFLNKDVVDAIGAGDSFNAGFLYRYINGHPVQSCQEFGNLTGAVSTTAAGGTGAFQDYESFKKKSRDNFGVIIE